LKKTPEQHQEEPPKQRWMRQQIDEMSKYRVQLRVMMKEKCTKLSQVGVLKNEEEVRF
jgi:hypothetical protein